MLYRESNNLDAIRKRIDRMQKDENIEGGDTEIMGQTLLEKIRAQDKTAKLSPKQKEEKLKEEQKRLHKFVKSFMAPPDQRLQEASPSKAHATGNFVLDKITKLVHKQRSLIQEDSKSIERLLERVASESSTKVKDQDKNEEENKNDEESPGRETAKSEPKEPEIHVTGVATPPNVNIDIDIEHSMMSDFIL